jgi:hypothetical protein
MNFNDHEPPHFHARYQEHEVVVGIGAGIVTGQMPKREMRRILRWAELHERDLASNWQRARDRKPLLPIPPLA